MSFKVANDRQRCRRRASAPTVTRSCFSADTWQPYSKGYGFDQVISARLAKSDIDKILGCCTYSAKSYFCGCYCYRLLVSAIDVNPIVVTIANVPPMTSFYLLLSHSAAY